jgi:poly(3-hydroxybutyrate) depolymerase
MESTGMACTNALQGPRICRQPWLGGALLLVALLIGGAGAAFAAAVPPGSAVPAASSVMRGWQKVSMPATGSYFELYVPPAWDGTTALPLVVFLHGYGSTPEVYASGLYDLSPAADVVGCLVAAPKSADISWNIGGIDDQIVAQTAVTAASMVPVDPARVSIAGHSAGGAAAYLLAYGTVSHYSAVFTLSAPFYAVSSVADPAYKAPIHMYYGTTDPNYATRGAYAALQQQWNALGVAWESDVENGWGHDDWPPQSMAEGFQFLVGKTYGTCAADATHACLQQSRYRIALTWQDASGRTGVGSPVAGAVSPDSAVLWFFAPSNWEMLVKVLDGCGLNQRVWVFAAATTNVAYTLTVTDTVTGKFKTYQNQAGRAAAAVTDTDAFATCP